MSTLDRRLVDVLDPVRDIAVGEVLEIMAKRLDSGAVVEPEPKMRDIEGKIRRDGALQLPHRADLLVNCDGRKLFEKIDCPQLLHFAPVTLVEPGGFVAIVSPFRWDAADILVESSQSNPNWAPLRHWFLEWFQSRFSEVAPDLDGVVHGMIGPTEVPGGWRFVIDLGSAPVQCIGDLITALAETGASRIRIGHLD